MPQKQQPQSLFDEDNSEAKKRRRSILLDVMVGAIIAVLIAVMIIREGKTLYEIPCTECQTQNSCESKCLGSCLQNAYDSVTSIGYKTSSRYMCDCRCDHFLHTLFNSKECGEQQAPFGDSCCADLNGDKVCDRYGQSQISISEEENQRIARCQQECNDRNDCTQDICEQGTNYVCMHTEIVPCCGNNVCEQEERCGQCLHDCGTCLSQESLFMLLEEIFGKGNWTRSDDRRGISYFVMGKGNVQLARILNSSLAFKSYSDFKAFEFLHPEQSGQSQTIIPHFILQDKDHFTSRGTINERIGYWLTPDKKSILIHNFNVYCSEDIYIRIAPAWTSASSDYLQKYEELESLNAFELERQDLLPRAIAILDKCPFGKAQNCPECSYRFFVENIIRSELGYEYIFMQNANGIYTADGKTKATMIALETSEGSAHEQTFLNNELAQDNNWTQMRIQEIEIDINKKSPAEPGQSRIFNYAQHKLSKDDIHNSYDVFNDSVKENIESSLYAYDITYDLSGIDGKYMGNVSGNKALMLSIIKHTFRCNNILVSLTSRQSSVYNYKMMPEQIEMQRKDILTNAAGQRLKTLSIKEKCE